MNVEFCLETLYYKLFVSGLWKSRWSTAWLSCISSVEIWHYQTGLASFLEIWIIPGLSPTADTSDMRVSHNDMTWPGWQEGIVLIVRSFHIIIYLNIITKPTEWSCSLHCARIRLKTSQLSQDYQMAQSGDYTWRSYLGKMLINLDWKWCSL